MREPWSALAEIEPGGAYVAFATALVPRSRRSTGRLFRGSRAVKRQLSSAEGLVGYSLLARPLRGEYGTLSLWDSDESLAAFARNGQHGRLQDALGPEMAPMTAVRWTVSGDDGRPTWADAMRRLAEAGGTGARIAGHR